MDEFSLTMEEINLLRLCRKILHGLITLSPGRSNWGSDGIIRITFPEYTEHESQSPIYLVDLMTNSVGQHQFYSFSGRSLGDALTSFKHQLELWVQES